MPTLERAAYLKGLYSELDRQRIHYVSLLSEWHEIQGRMEVAERSLANTRDHLYSYLADDKLEGFEDMPADWILTLGRVRFVGARAADAIVAVLRTSSEPVTTKELLRALNESNFRFRTTTPLKEIHAATMRHPRIRREGDKWVYEPAADEAADKEGEQADVA